MIGYGGFIKQREISDFILIYSYYLYIIDDHYCSFRTVAKPLNTIIRCNTHHGIYLEKRPPCTIVDYTCRRQQQSDTSYDVSESAFPVPTLALGPLSGGNQNCQQGAQAKKK